MMRPGGHEWPPGSAGIWTTVAQWVTLVRSGMRRGAARWPSRRRMLPTVIGVSLVTTIVADVAVVVVRDQGAGTAGPSPNSLIAAADATGYTPGAVAPLRKAVVPHVLVASGQTIPAADVEAVRHLKGVKGVEVVDAARALVAGKRVGVMGVEPSTFRAYTPDASAKSDALWRDLSGGGGAEHQTAVRVGAYATMGSGQVDAVVSHATARSIGMPSGNALLVSAPHVNVTRLRRALAKALPHGVRTAALESRSDGTRTPGGTPSGQ